MSTYLLIHGSWHGAWCWYKVLPRLRAAGHNAIAIDMPGRGADRRPAAEVSMHDYVEAIGRVLDESEEPVVLVGHSRGGIAISQAAEARSARVRRLVYLAAFLVPDGETILPLALTDSDSLVLPSLELNQAEGWDMLRSEAFRDALYADCSEEDVALAHSLLSPEPIGPTNTPLSLSDGGFGSIPRSYIELLEDRAVSPSLQRRMLEAMPCDEVISLEASHSAYFSRPGELARAILRAAGDA